MDSPRVDDADLPLWRTLWEEDRRLAMPEESGFFGKLTGPLKRFIRRFTSASQRDLWERQRLFNLLIQHHLEARQELVGDLDRLQDIDRGRHNQIDELYKSLSEQDLRLLWLENMQQKGLERIVKHHDAVYAMVDLKMDQYRRQAVELRGQLVSLLEVAQSGSVAALESAIEEQSYVELERRHRGTEEEIADRIKPYLPFLGTEGEVLDLGCGRGEALELFRQQGLAGRGVDSNAAMVALTRSKGLEAVEGDLFEVLLATPESSLAGIVSFHVIEHLPPGGIDRLVRLAWRALRPGGVLILETPSPLSVVVGARNFWLDPTHQRPVHPDSLKLAYEFAGFEQVERIDRQPFSETDRLHEIPTAELPEEMRPLALNINVLRDQLDALLFGFQDFGMVGRKPGGNGHQPVRLN